MNVLVTVDNLGNDMGFYFSLSANTGTVSPSTCDYNELLAGVFVMCDAGTTGITVCSLGVCTDCITIPVTLTTTTTAEPTTTTSTTTTSTTTTSTTTTSTTTTSTTAEPTTTTTTAESLNSDTFGRSSTNSGACGNLVGGGHTYYFSGSFGTGTYLFTDSGGTTPLTGYTKVAWNGDSQVYDINSGTGQVGGGTGYYC